MTGISEYKSVSFHDLKITMHEYARTIFEREYPLAQESLTQLGGFWCNLGVRDAELQNGKVTVPSKEDLLAEEQSYLITYWCFRESSQKTKELARELSSIAVYLTPQPRLYTDEQSLKNEAPEYHKSFLACEKLSLEYMKEVSNWHGKVDALHTKMVEQLDNKVAYTLQRFCQIVARDGKPLNSILTMVDYCTKPVISNPKPKESKEALPEDVQNTDGSASQEEKKDLGDTTEKVQNNQSTEPLAEKDEVENPAKNGSTATANADQGENKDQLNDGIGLIFSEKSSVATTSTDKKLENIEPSEGASADLGTQVENEENLLDLSASAVF